LFLFPCLCRWLFSLGLYLFPFIVFSSYHSVWSVSVCPSWHDTHTHVMASNITRCCTWWRRITVTVLNVV
jgi:hypothetical protein